MRGGELKDSVLMKLDRTLAFDHYPADVLHTVLGTGISAHVLAWSYELFLVFVPLSLGAALVWSKNVSTGFWYVTALCVNWVLGALSYYWVPSLGPFIARPSLFVDLPHTGVTEPSAHTRGRARRVHRRPATAPRRCRASRRSRRCTSRSSSPLP